MKDNCMERKMLWLIQFEEKLFDRTEKASSSFVNPNCSNQKQTFLCKYSTLDIKQVHRGKLSM